MNAFNRALLLLLSLAVFLGGGLVFLVASGLATPDSAPGSPELSRLMGEIRIRSEGAEAAWLGGGAATAILGLALFILEAGVRRPAPKLMLLRSDPKGNVTVSLQGLRRLAEHEIGTIYSVERVEAVVRNHKKGLRLDCHLQLAPDANAPSVAAEVRERLMASLENHVGAPPDRINVHTQVGRPNTHRRKVR